MSLVDVIIPFYNTRIEYVRQTLASVLAQTFPHWTAYIVNDGSAPANTLELEQLLAEFNDPRFVYFQQKNRRLAGARNTGIRAGRSEFLACLDSDDLWHPHALATQVEVLQSDPSIGVSVGGGDNLFGTEIARYTPGSITPLRRLSPQQLFYRMLQNNVIGIHMAVCRRVDAEAVGLFDENFDCLEDKEFWLRMMLHGCRFHFSDTSLAIYRRHGESLSRNVEKMRQGRIRLVGKLDGLVPHAPAHWAPIDWLYWRQQMMRHAYMEAAEEALDGGDYRTAISYSLPHYSGLSRKAGLLTLRGVYRLAKSTVSSAA